MDFPTDFITFPQKCHSIGPYPLKRINITFSHDMTHLTTVAEQINTRDTKRKTNTASYQGRRHQN